MNKKKKLFLASSLALVLSASLITYNTLKPSKTKPEEKKTLAIFLQDSSGSENYSISSSNKFPKDGYVLNTEKSTCKNGGVLSQDPTTKKIQLRVSNNDSCSLYFDKELTPSEKTIAKLGKKAKEGTPTFANAATTDETADGLYAMEDDYGTSYYYRGNVADNYVKFAGFYWRIIRVNGDGSLRIIYDGTSAHANTESSIDRLAMTSVAWNTTNYNDAKYVGYMYGGSNGSGSTSKSQAQTNETDTNIKTQIETWYKTNIRDKGYDEYVSDNIFCNDRSTPGKEATGWSIDTGLGYGTNYTAYGATARSNVWNSDANLVQPKLTCENKNDAFTKSDTEKGNGKLSEKIGLITADEVVAAGSGKVEITNQSYYLYKGWYWSLSPYRFNGSNAYVFGVNTLGRLTYNNVSNAGGVAPVINLRAEYVASMTGNGTQASPFEVK